MPDPPTARRRLEPTAADEAERKARLDTEARPHGLYIILCRFYYGKMLPSNRFQL
jgi:hypothetical protein